MTKDEIENLAALLRKTQFRALNGGEPVSWDSTAKDIRNSWIAVVRKAEAALIEKLKDDLWVVPDKDSKNFAKSFRKNPQSYENKDKSESEIEKDHSEAHREGGESCVRIPPDVIDKAYSDQVRLMNEVVKADLRRELEKSVEDAVKKAVRCERYRLAQALRESFDKIMWDGRPPETEATRLQQTFNHPPEDRN